MPLRDLLESGQQEKHHAADHRATPYRRFLDAEQLLGQGGREAEIDAGDGLHGQLDLAERAYPLLDRLKHLLDILHQIGGIDHGELSVGTPTMKRELKRRSAIEPMIGHDKNDGRLGRIHLLGADGDKINALLAAAGHNLRLVLTRLTRLLARFIDDLVRLMTKGGQIAIAANQETVFLNIRLDYRATQIQGLRRFSRPTV